MITKFLSFLLTLTFVATIALAEDEKSANGKIAGKVMDKATNETMVGLAVVVDGTTKASPTNIEGRYELTSLEPGTYKIVLKYLGYQTKIIDGVVVKAGQVTNLDVIMEESVTETGTVEIVSTFRKESIGALYSIQKNNISVSDGISSDVIKRSPDKSTADILKRVSGTSVQDNKFVIIRGLSDRYNFAMLNGAPLPSTEADKRAFSFDIIPSNLVDNLLINKTASPDLPGDFAGGVINISTKDFPEERFLTIGVGAGNNSVSTGKNYLTGQKAQDVPNDFKSRAAYLKLTPEEQAKQSTLFANNWSIVSKKASPILNGQLSYGNTFNLGKESKLGVIASYSGRTSENIITTDRREYENKMATRKAYSYKDTVSKVNTTNAGLLNVSYIINQNNKIALKNIINKSTDINFTNRSGVDSIGTESFVKSFSTYTLDRDLISSQLEGTNRIGESGVKLDWNLGRSSIVRNEPDWRNLEYRLSFERAADDPTAPYVAAIGNGLNKNSGFSYFSNLNEKIYNGAFNATIDLNKNNLDKESKQIVKLGLYKQYRTRTYSARALGYKTGKNFSSKGGNSIITKPSDSLFTRANIDSQIFVIDDISRAFDNYTANSNVDAAYIMFDNKILKKIRLSYGFRVEDYRQALNTSLDNGQALNVRNNVLNILPSINLTAALTEKVNLRAAASKTVSRPEFREISPLNIFDFSTSFSLNGNPALVPSTINNYDLKLEYYPSGSQLLSIGGFYKDFFNPVESSVELGNAFNTRGFTYTNASSAKSLGLEAEVRFKLEKVFNEALENFTIFANGARILSQVKLDTANSNDRALQGQSPYLLNTGLQYANKNNKISTTLLYNRIGNRIVLVGNKDIYDYYEKGRGVLDFQIAVRPVKGLEAKLNFGDILAQDVIVFQNQNPEPTTDATFFNRFTKDVFKFEKNSKYEAGTDRYITSSKIGRNISLGLSYTF